jgi:dihydrofolate reductase
MIAAVVAIDSNYGIGGNNDLLAHIPEDMKMFKEITTGGSVIVGSRTYQSLPKKPLPDRTNIVITRKCKKKPKVQKDGSVHSNMNHIKSWLSNSDVISDNDGIYVIGGGVIYKELLPFCERAYVTKILHAYDNADTHFPNIDEMPEWEMTYASEVKEYNGLQYQFCIYDRVDYEIVKIESHDDNEDIMDGDMVITVRTFNGYKAVVLRLKDDGELQFYIDDWEYLKDKKSAHKFLNEVLAYNTKQTLNKNEG